MVGEGGREGGVRWWGGRGEVVGREGWVRWWRGREG